MQYRRRPVERWADSGRSKLITCRTRAKKAGVGNPFFTNKVVLSGYGWENQKKKKSGGKNKCSKHRENGRHREGSITGNWGQSMASGMRERELEGEETLRRVYAKNNNRPERS